MGWGDSGKRDAPGGGLADAPDPEPQQGQQPPGETGCGAWPRAARCEAGLAPSRRRQPPAGRRIRTLASRHKYRRGPADSLWQGRGPRRPCRPPRPPPAGRPLLASVQDPQVLGKAPGPPTPAPRGLRWGRSYYWGARPALPALRMDGWLWASVSLSAHSRGGWLALGVGPTTLTRK